jgi:hypothetical protein
VISWQAGMRSHLLPGWIMILILAAGFPSGMPRAGEALVCTDPVRLEIGAGQSETLQILLVNADKVYGIDLQAAFDPAVVEVVDADSKKPGIQMLPGGFLKADYAARNLADNKTGTLRYVATQLNPTPPSSGRGIILSIRFRGRKAGTHTRVTIVSAVIADRRGIKQPVTTRGGDLVIVKPKPSTPTPVAVPTNFLPAPALPTSTLAQAGSQPTAYPSPTARLTDGPAQPGAIVFQDDAPILSGSIPIQEHPARSPGADAALSDRALTYVTVGGFSGAILFFGLTVWLLAAKRRKNRPGNDVQSAVRAGDGGGTDLGIDHEEGSAKSN